MGATPSSSAGAAGAAGSAPLAPSATTTAPALPPAGGSNTDREKEIHSLSGLLPSSEVKWREGNKTEAVACPAARGVLTYAKALERPEFKEYLYRHLDSDELVSSLLTENATDDRVLLLGIHLMQQLSGDKKEQYLEQIAAFDDLVAVGARVDLSDTQSIIEKELEVFNRAESSPFLRAFQRRIAVLLNCKEFIAMEGKAAKEQRRPRVYATSDLTTSKYPQLQLLDSLKKTGINMLLLFPICFPLLTSPEERRLFSVPIEELCDRLSQSLSNLELFSSWSPAQRPLQSPIKLKLSSARASDGNASHAIDGKQTTFWSTKKTTSSFWSVQIEQPCICTSIKIAWRSVTPTSFHFAGVSEDVGAPKVLIISVQYFDATEHALSSTSPPESEYQDAFIVKPDQERIKQGSWEQVYTFPQNSSDGRLVASIKLSMVRPAASNTTGSIKIHSFQAFSSTPKSTSWVDSLSLMTSLQEALYPIVKRFPEMQSSVFPAITAIIRSSGSLKLALFLIRELMSGEFPPTAACTVRELQNVVLLEHKKVAQRSSSTVDVSQPDAIFDKDSKSSQIKITEEGFRITHELVTGSAPTTAAYCMLNCVMGNAQTWVWEFSAIPSSLELDGCYFGVAKRPITNEDYQISSDYYVVRCFNGDLYHDGKITVPSEGPFLPRILASDVCKFTYDSCLQTLSLMINDNDFGVLFRDVQPGVSPIVLFTGEGQVAKSRSVRLKQTAIREQCVINVKELDALQENLLALMNDDGDSSSSPAATSNRSMALHLLTSISCLAQIRMEELIREEASKEKKRGAIQSILEYPFSVEVSADVISSLVILLQFVTSSFHDQAGKAATISILRILDSQFFCLTKAGVDPETVGFPDKDSDDSVAKTAASVILALTDSGDKDIQMEASKVYARGAVLFLRTVVEKIDLVLTLIRVPGSVGIVEPDTSRFLILAMIIKHLSKIDDVLEIFSKLKTKDHSFELRLVEFVAGLLRIVSEINISHIKSSVDSHSDDKGKAMAEFENVICKLLQRFQEHLIFELTTKATGPSMVETQQDCWSPAFMNVLVAYSQNLVVNGERVLCASNEASQEPLIGWSGSQRRLRNSIVPLLLQPLLHSFVICKDNLPLVARLLPQAVHMLEITTRLCRLSKPCAEAASLIFASIQRKIPRMTSATEQLGTRGGWKVIKAVFESGEASYSVSEEGLVYTSQSQSNTCGIVNIGFSSSQRAAWEFQLLADTLGDECSLFGAARLPLTSRCYNNSPDLWMRRAYNGHMYCQGRTTTMSPPLDRIHPGDIVRIEFDGKAKTLSYSVNGKELELGFSEISDTVYPSCGSYRPGVAIRLIKVEIFKDINNDEDEEPYRASTVINWNVTSPDNENRAPDNTLKIIVPKDSPVPGAEKWLTAQADRGVDRGIHSWSFEFSELSRSAYGVGVVVGASLDHGVKLATRYFLGPEISEAAWYSDGTLWSNGRQVAENFGNKFLPLDRLSVVSMHADLVEQTISYSVDGEFVGIAFGPAGSNARAVFALPAKQGEGKSPMVFPAASISSASQTIRISTAGFNGSSVLPLQLSLQKASASVIGRLSAALMMGHPVDKKEAGFLPLLQSSLLIGGLEPTAAGHGINAPSWKEMWARQRSLHEADLPTYSDEIHVLSPVSEDENEVTDFLATISDSITSADGATQRSSLINWLELINPEPSGQRIIMQRLNSYNFPTCEYPLLACLLKHTGLASEALAACKVMRENPGVVPTPSADMVSCWKTVQQLRRYLRGERQKLKSLLATGTSSSAESSPSLTFPSFSDVDAVEGDTAVAGGGVVSQSAETVLISQENASLFFGNNDNIAWCRQPRSVADSSVESLAINAVGIDPDTSFVFVRISLESTNIDETASLEVACSLHLDGASDPSTSASDAEFAVLERCGDRLVGCFRVDVDANDLFERIVAPTADVRFTCTISNATLTSVLLQIPTYADIGVSLKDLKKKELAEQATIGQALPLFTDLCSRVESKVRFLLGIAVASSSSLDAFDEKLKKQHRSDAFQRPSFGAESGNDGQERWKRVIDFLRVHSQIRKQISQEQEPLDSFGERSPLRINAMRLQDRLGRPAEADYDSDLESSSLADSSMQACYLFAITEGAHSSPTCLEEIMQKRLNRAEQRIFGMQALHCVISLPDAFSDPFCMEELLLFVKGSFTISPHRGSGLKQLFSEKVHYLVNLEGCPTASLLRVQQSFAQLFSGVARLVAQYADTWDALSQRACESSGSMERGTSGGDVAHQLVLEPTESHLALGPLRLLLSLWTLSYSNRDHKFIMECGLIPSLHKIVHLATFERVVEIWYSSGLKLVEYFSLHCERFKDSKKWVPLPSTFINSRLKSGSLSSRTVILHLLLMPFKEISENDRDRLGLESSFQLLCATLGAADVSLLNQKVLSLIRFREETEEREKNKKDAAEAAAKATKDANTTARLAVCGVFDSTLKESSITLSDYSRVAVLNLDDPSSADPANVYTTVCFDCDVGMVESGNYFEIEIITLGGGDFGIGLADRDSVGIDSPLGTTASSYCYKGDNGTKLGAGSTPTVWLPFQQGDVIGCGLDMISRSIYYTKNGQFLGAAFDGVAENKLWPIVGSFATSGNEVSAKVKLNFGVETFRFSGSDGVIMSAIPTIVANRAALHERTLQVNEAEAEHRLAAEATLAASLRSGRRSRASTMELNNDVSVEAVCEEEYRSTLEVLTTNLRSATAYLFEFNSLRAYCNSLLRFILVTVCECESLSMGRDVKPRSDDLVPQTRTLLKQRSVFGTPRFLTLEDGLLLREGLVAAMVHQLLLGATYVSTAEPSTGGSAGYASLSMNQTPPQGLGKCIKDIQAAQLGGAPASGSSSAVLEVLEVEKHLYELLSTLSTLLSINKTLKNQLSKGMSLATLFLLLQHGSVRIKSVATTMLRSILPDISPAEGEAALSAECKASLCKYEDPASSPSSSVGGARRQKRRIPDGVVRLLLLKAMESLSLNDESGPHPLGYGDMALNIADQNVSLIQHLFEAPMWTELVACNITDAFRSASAIVDSLRLDEPSPIFGEEQRTAILAACAACTVLSGLGTLRPGSAIIGTDGTKGTLIKLHETEQRAFVLFNKPGDNTTVHVSDVENVDRNAIKAVRSCVHVDLSRLSQPLLPQLTNLMKGLLEKTSFSTTMQYSGSDALLMRLSFVVSNAISTLLDRQPDLVIDATHDAMVIGNIIRMSLSPCGLDKFASANSLTLMWNQMQARVLERSTTAEEHSLALEFSFDMVSSSEQNEADSDIGAGGSPAAQVVVPEEMSTSDSSSPSGLSELVQLPASSPLTNADDVPRVRQQQTAIELLSAAGGDSQHNARNLSVLQQRLEYFMGDALRATASLVSDAMLPTEASDLDEGWFLGQQANPPNPVEFSSENILVFADNQMEGSSPEAPYYATSLIEMTLSSITFRSTPASQDVQSVRIPTNLPPSSYVIECDSEGPLFVDSKRKRLGMTADTVSGGKDVIVSYFDANLGLPMFELVDTATLKIAHSFFDKKCISTQEMCLLDQACTILRLRRIAAKLLIEGNLNLNHLENLEDWDRFVKLTAVTTMMNLDVKEDIQRKRSKILNSLCASLIARSRSSLVSPEASLGSSLARQATSDGAVVATLVRGISDTFTHLTSSSISLSRVARNKESSPDDILHCSSPHPFMVPFTTTGKFEIPPDWKGVMVSFHPKCSTPSKLASLDFFKSAKSYEENKPAYSYFGQSSSFQPFILTDSKCLYFRFRASPGGDRPMLGVVQLDGPAKIENTEGIDKPHSSVSMRKQYENSALPVGLGEDDSLFNLFDEGSRRELQKSALVAAECEPMTQGCWFFEVMVDAVSIASSDAASSDRIGLCAPSASSLGNEKKSCAFAASGHVVHAGLNVSGEVSLGAWAAGDILGCVFDLSDEYRVRFARNGTWSEPICGSVDESFIGFRVAFSVSAETKLSPNFGENEFKFAPSSDICSEWKCLLARPLPNVTKELAWGYHFCVKPLRELHMRVTRAIELIAQIKPDEGHRGADPPKGIWVWRAKSAENFTGCGDIVTTDCRVPRGTIIVDKSQCVFPATFKKVFMLSKSGAGGVTLWRPVPPSSDYVALGDVVVANTSVTPPPTTTVLCVPRWAVKECSPGAKVYKSKKGGTDASKGHSVSVWMNRCALGTFFGSPFDRRVCADATKADDSEVKGIGVPYYLSRDVANDISGEWCNDEDICRGAPSLSWSAELLDFLLENAVTRPEVLTSDTFSMLVKYATSSSSPAPLVVIPLMIRMIRMARDASVELPLSSIDGLCKSILKKAQSKSGSPSANGFTLSNSLVRLVDLVVETQSAQVAAAAIKDMKAAKADRGDDALAAPSFLAPASKSASGAPPEPFPAPPPAPEDGVSALIRIERPSSLALPEMRSHDASRPWWEREGLISHAVLEAASAISLSNVKSIFIRDQLIRRLKQVLIFLAAMGATPGLMTYRDPAFPETVVPVTCRYPKLIVAKVWHDYASVCTFVESDHPYKVGKFEKRISFPGAEKLRIMVDSRTTLGPGATVSLTVGLTKILVTSAATTMNLQGNELLLSFDVAAVEVDGVLGEPGNPANDWGWAIVVHAMGPLYESSSVSVELDPLDESTWPSESEGKSDSLLGLLPPEPLSPLSPPSPLSNNEMPPIVLGAAGSVPVVSALAGGSSSSKAVGATSGKKSAIQSFAEERIIELVTVSGTCGNRGKIAVPHASEVEVKLSRPHPSTDDAKFVRVVVVEYKGQTGDEAAEQQVVKVLLPASKSHTVKFSVKTSTVNYCVYSLTKACLDATLAAEDAAKRALTPDQAAGEEERPIPSEAAGPSGGGGGDPIFLDSSLWCCEQCTYVNAVEAHTCEMCGFLHATLAWSCAGCTFVNMQSSRNCGICGTPHHAGPVAPGAAEAAEEGDEEDEDMSDNDDDYSGDADEAGAGASPSKASKDSSPKVVVEAGGTGGDAVDADKKDVLVISLKGKLSNEESFLSRLEGALCADDARVYTPREMQADMKKWGSVEDAVLLEFINSERRGVSSESGLLANPGKLILPKKSFMYHPNSKLASFNLLDIQCRMLVLEAFNKALDCILPIINLQSNDVQSIGATLRRHNRYVFMSVKEPMLERALQASCTPTGTPGVPAALSLDNIKALMSREKGEVELTQSQCCFAQAFRQLRDKDPLVYRYIFSGDRVFSINFHGESGIDAGGVFREGVSRIIEDLFSPHFNLLLLCPNGQHETHTNLDKFVPNPAHTSALAMEMLEFMGRLMAMSLRAKLALPFELPSIVWKQLVGEEVDMEDLVAIDAITCHLLTAVQNCEEDGIVNEEIFAEKYGDKLRWSYNGSDGIERELRGGGGGTRIVSFDSRLEWCEAVKAVRLGEFNAQIKAIARGMDSVVSMRVLQLFSWQQLEILVSGDPRIDIESWKSFTDSSGVKRETASLFWTVMASLTPKEQSGFIRFAWGRSRLPPPKDFHVKMKLTRMASGASGRLPIAHTCFFSVELPDYSSEDEMRHGLLTAINFGGGVLLG